MGLADLLSSVFTGRPTDTKDMLRVTLLWANSLPERGGGATLNVVSSVGRDKRRSSPVDRSVNPEWPDGGEYFDFALEPAAVSRYGTQPAAALRLVLLTTGGGGGGGGGGAGGGGSSGLAGFFDETLGGGEVSVARPQAALKGDSYVTVPLSTGGTLQLRVRLFVRSQLSRDALHALCARRLQRHARARLLRRVHARDAAAAPPVYSAGGDDADGSGDDAAVCSGPEDKATGQAVEQAVEGGARPQPEAPPPPPPPQQQERKAAAADHQHSPSPPRSASPPVDGRVRVCIEGLNSAIDRVNEIEDVRGRAEAAAARAARANTTQRPRLTNRADDWPMIGRGRTTPGAALHGPASATARAARRCIRPK